MGVGAGMGVGVGVGVKTAVSSTISMGNKVGGTGKEGFVGDDVAIIVATSAVAATVASGATSTHPARKIIVNIPMPYTNCVCLCIISF